MQHGCTLMNAHSLSWWRTLNLNPEDWLGIHYVLYSSEQGSNYETNKTDCGWKISIVNSPRQEMAVFITQNNGASSR